MMEIRDVANTIINGNCAEVLQTLPENSIDLVVTSPPYDNLRDYKGYEFDPKAIIDALYKVVKPGGVVVWVIGDAVVDGEETGSSFRQALMFKESGFKLHDTMIYEKSGSPFPARKDGKRYTQIFEFMFVFTKGKIKTGNLICDKRNRWAGWVPWGKNKKRAKDGELKDTAEPKATTEFGVRNNIWRYNTGGGFSYSGTKEEQKLVRNHPAVFPEELARDNILSWSSKGDTVLDPMCGSGTTLKMAMLEDRNYIGIDISAEYCELSRKRIEISKQNRSLYLEARQAEKDTIKEAKDLEFTLNGVVQKYKKIPPDELNQALELINQWKWIEPGQAIKDKAKKEEIKTNASESRDTKESH